VQDAYDKKMDSLPNQLAEVNNYKQQVVENFLNEQSDADFLIKEAFGFSQKDILLGHLFIAADASNPIASSTAAQQATKAEAALKSGIAFSDVVKQYSTDADRNTTGGEVGSLLLQPIRHKKNNPIE
jgi:peptidyl-prolyl cis-trans isomerase SurA